jgi:hypothetical protein
VPAIAAVVTTPIVTPASNRPQYHGRTPGNGRIGATMIGGRAMGGRAMGGRASGGRAIGWTGLWTGWVGGRAIRCAGLGRHHGETHLQGLTCNDARERRSL